MRETAADLDNAREWADFTIRWGSAASGDDAALNEGLIAEMPVFVATDPRQDLPLAREISWMMIDAFAALRAAHPAGPGVGHVHDLWRDVVRGMSRRIAEATILNRTGSYTGIDDVRLAGLIATRIEDEPTWIALSSGGMEILEVSSSGGVRALPTADDVGYDLPGELWTVPMEAGQRFVIGTGEVCRDLADSRTARLVHQLRRAERASSTIVSHAGRRSSSQAAIVVDVMTEEEAAALASPPTLLGEPEPDAGVPEGQVPGDMGLEALGIGYANKAAPARRSHGAPPALDDFRFISYLGSGGFSDVYLYEEQLPRRLVAIKVLSKRSLGEGTSSQFRDEVDLMAQLSGHPSVVSIYDANVAESGHPYVVMQYCPMPSLAERLASGPLPMDEVLKMGVQVAGAVHTAHVMGILHYALKPANVLYSEFGRPLLGDFGIATLVGASNDDVLGASLPWAAPEVLLNRPSGTPADVYSLAATVYTALAGHAPYSLDGQETKREYVARVLDSDVPSVPAPLGVGDEATGRLDAILRRAMSHDPGERPESAAEFGRELQEVQAAAGHQPSDMEIPG